MKLWQFDEGDDNQFSIDMDGAELRPLNDESGVQQALLSKRANELVFLETWDKGTVRQLGEDGGAEVLVLSGHIEFHGSQYPQNAWIRIPAGRAEQICALTDDVRVWIKTRHLSEVRAPAA